VVVAVVLAAVVLVVVVVVVVVTTAAVVLVVVVVVVVISVVVAVAVAAVGRNLLLFSLSRMAVRNNCCVLAMLQNRCVIEDGVKGNIWTQEGGSDTRMNAIA
jgi:hypothetical protein